MKEIERTTIVAKFGGSSMATAETIKNHVTPIVMENRDIRAVVVSAPGKRFEGDAKITNLLLETDSLIMKGKKYNEPYGKASERYEEIAKGLGCLNETVGWLDEVLEAIESNYPGRDWLASKGEWLMAKSYAEFLGEEFVDAKDLIKMRDNGGIDPRTYENISNKHEKQNGRIIVPGFYGEDEFGNIKVLERGGSDITGAVLAKGLAAEAYYNYTDVDGLLAAQPAIVKNPRLLRNVTYEEIRELGFRGAEVLQKDTVLVVAESGIPIVLRNTFNPNHPGTRIEANREIEKDEEFIGIAGKSGFVAFNVKETGLNDVGGIGKRMLEVVEKEKISFEHMPSGRNNMSIVCEQEGLNGKTVEIAEKLKKIVAQGEVSIDRDLGLISVVGENIKNKTVSVSRRLFEALGKADISPSLVVMPPNGISVVVGVDSKNVNRGVNVLYDALIR
jgi:aspartate kinase